MQVLSDGGVTYPPLDVPKPLAENVWIVDSGPLRLLGVPLPVRMTVIRLADGALLLHSPTRFETGLKHALEAFGPIRHLVAPNVAHWSYLKVWQQACPEATTWAAPGLRERAQVRASGVRLDRDLPDAPPPDWAGEIDQAIVPGGAGFREVAFFHRPSRTLVLTDLIVNLEPHKLPLPIRLAARALGILAPHGRAPIYLRLIVRARRAEAGAAAVRLVGWAPERVVFAHGRLFERDGTTALQRSLDWIIP